MWLTNVSCHVFLSSNKLCCHMGRSTLAIPYCPIDLQLKGGCRLYGPFLQWKHKNALLNGTNPCCTAQWKQGDRSLLLACPIYVSVQENMTPWKNIFYGGFPYRSFFVKFLFVLCPLNWGSSCPRLKTCVLNKSKGYKCFGSLPLLKSCSGWSSASWWNSCYSY